MSLIHEALKKVERQRQLGSVPTLDSPRYQRRRPRWPWLLLVLLIFVLAGAWIWRAPLVHKARTVVSLLTGSEVSDTGRKTDTQPAVNDQAPTTRKPGQPGTLAQAGLDTSKTAAQKVATSRPTANPEPTPTRQSRPSPGQAKSPPATADGRTAEAQPPSAPPSKLSKPSAATPAKPPAANPSEKVAAVGQLKKKGPPMYWELPYAQRRDIPDLSITMHMYTEIPADRFVIINGVRQVEGDTLESGLKLIAINPDSITLDKDGQDFRVPRQGSH